MALRKLRIALLPMLLVSAAVLPAQAAEDGIGVATSAVGSIVTETVEEPVEGSDTPTYEVVGDCTYAGSQSGNQMVIRFGGGAVAFGMTPAQATVVVCEITTDLGDTMTRDFVLPGPAGVAQDITPSWRVAPITICVSGKAFFGPTPVVEKSMPRACRRTII